MHGQVKVRRSLEQDASFRKAQNELKMRVSVLADEVLSRRRAGVYDLAILEKLSELLEQCPDMFTLWNYRREILLNANTESSHDYNPALYDKELALTGRCLLKNPKSYATWHHRSWVMSHHPHPDWKGEINLCNKALKADDRNFHCWDYRRFVVKNAQVGNTEELDFTNWALEENFSNYSAWHYRSGLVGADDEICTVATPVSPPPSFETYHENGAAEVPYNEFDLVHNAVFTDPKDQGPWFYYWWLLGRGAKKCYLRELYLSRSLQRAVFVFTSPKVLSAVSQLRVDVVVSDPESTSFKTYSPNDLDGWKSALDDNVSAVWWFDLPKSLIEDSAVSVTVHSDDSLASGFNSSKALLFCQMEADQKESLTRVALDPRRLLNFMISPSHEPSSLVGELDTVRELISLEPNNKWALLTLVSLVRYIRPPNCACEVEAAIKALQNVDSHRKRFYADMSSAHVTEDALVASYAVNSRAINLSEVGLTRVCCLDWCTLMTELNFSKNNLDMLPETCAYLVCLKELNLDDNHISTLKPIAGLPQLKRLSVCHNLITHFEGLEPILSCPLLRDLDITGNKVTELPDFTILLADHPLSKRSLSSLNVVYNKPVIA